MRIWQPPSRQRTTSTISLITSIPKCRPTEKPADTVLNSLKDVPLGTPIEEIRHAADAFGLDFGYMKAVAKIESDFDPKQRTGSYIGLYQLSKYEFNRYGDGDILNARDNAIAAAYKIIVEAELFELRTDKKPTLSDLYLIHQQGIQGAEEHVSHPERIAWQSMCATEEGQQKGEKWCRRAIWQNTLPEIKKSGNRWIISPRAPSSACGSSGLPTSTRAIPRRPTRPRRSDAFTSPRRLRGEGRVLGTPFFLIKKYANPEDRLAKRRTPSGFASPRR